MELSKISNEIEKRIRLLEVGRKALQDRAQRKADTIGEYEKELSKTIMRLRNGDELECDGQWIKDPPVTIIEKIARGICFREKINMELADAEYRNAIEGMKSIQAELNGFQSIYRHQDET